MPRNWTLRAYYFASFAVGGIYLPYFPRWLQARGMDGAHLGVISAVAPAVGLIAPTAFGVVADALGLRGGLLQLACLGALASFGTLTVAVAIGMPLGFSGLFAAALAIALFRSPMSMMADVVAVEFAAASATTYGRLRLWGSLGFLAAAVAGGWLVDPRQRLALPLTSTCCLAAGFLASLALPRKADLHVYRRSTPPAGRVLRAAPSARIGELLLFGDFRLFLVCVFLSQCGHAAYDMCFSLRLYDLGVPGGVVGVAWGIGVGAEVVLMASSAWVFRRFRASSVLAVALACAAIRWALLATVRSTALILILQPLHALSFGLVWIAAVTYGSRRVPARSLATGQGLLTTASGAGSAVGMLTWGPVYQHAGAAFVFAGAACFAVCASAFAVALDRKAGAPISRGAAAEQMREG